MRELIQEAVGHCTSLDQVKDCLVRFFEQGRRERGWTNIGLVSGIINSDGSEARNANIQTMIKYTEMLRTMRDHPIFCTVDVFEGLWEQLEEIRLPMDAGEERFRQFWKEVIQSGCVSDLFMLPGWERSVGANDEHQTAQSLGLTIHYLEGKLP